MRVTTTVTLDVELIQKLLNERKKDQYGKLESMSRVLERVLMEKGFINETTG